MDGKYAALDVSDHKEVDAAYGTLDDFKAQVGKHQFLFLSCCSLSRLSKTPNLAVQ